MDGQTNYESGPLSFRRFQLDGSLVLFNDDGMRDGKSLPGALADLFGGEKGLENPAADGLWDAGAVVLDANFNPFTFTSRTDCDPSFSGRVPVENLANSMRRIHDQVEENLIQFARQTIHTGNIAVKIGF
jgi:hypothetical protein